MSFTEDVAEFGEALAGLVGAGVAVREAATALGLPLQKAYRILRAVGHPVGKAGVSHVRPIQT